MAFKAHIKLDRHAFARGFWRGLAAPLMIYSNEALPANIKDCTFKPLPPMKRGDLRGDWRRVGDALRNASARAMNG